jgi:putative ABC transport system substrate-binding protein
MKKQNLVWSCLALSVLVSSLASCGNSSLKTIGILQVGTHDALDLDRQGFIEELETEGFKEGEKVQFVIKNPEGDEPTQQTMAATLVSSCDMVFGIATSSSIDLKSAATDAKKTSLPILFSAVTDPVGAGLVKSFTDHGNVVGTSDAGPTSKNIDLFKEFSITKIGILYTKTEDNSIVQFKETQAACAADSIELVDGGINAQSEIQTKLEAMIGQGIKGLFVPTDNLVATTMTALKDTLIKNKIVTVCADKSSTDEGGSLGFSVDYKLLGKTTGKMAAKILNGTDPSTIDCSLADSFPLELNSSFFTATGIIIPESISAQASK